MNLYNGNVTTDAAGFAAVELPAWFEALNGDFRYQLTVIDQFAQAIVAGKIANGRFVIRTDKPDVEVSWQVTGIRQDPYAEQHRISVEEASRKASTASTCTRDFMTSRPGPGFTGSNRHRRRRPPMRRAISIAELAARAGDWASHRARERFGFCPC